MCPGRVKIVKIMGDLEAGFAKLQGEDFEYYMQTYSIVLGRNSKKSSVDVDLAGLGGGMNISRQHARIYYDFERRRFVLEVLGKNGCYVEGVLHLPGAPSVKLDSQNLLQIGDKKFYFLLPAKKLSSRTVAPPSPGSGAAHRKRPAGSSRPCGPLHDSLEDASPLLQASKKGRVAGKQDASLLPGVGGSREKKASNIWIGTEDHKLEARRRGDEATTTTLLKNEEREVISVVTTVLQEVCAPGEWMPLGRLHSELTGNYSHLVPQAKLRRVMGGQEIGTVDGEARVRAWASLLVLLKKNPEKFVINTKLKGRITAEYVALVSEGV